MSEAGGVTKVEFSPDYSKQEGKLTVVLLDRLPLPEGLKIKERSIVTIRPSGVGGNHKHPRTEVLYAPEGDLTLYWLDSNGERHKEGMSPEETRYKLFVIPSFVPHAVVNETDEPAFILELANEYQNNVVDVKVV